MSQKKNLPQSPCPYKGHPLLFYHVGSREHVNLQVYMYHLEPHIMENYYCLLLEYRYVTLHELYLLHVKATHRCC